MGNKMFTSSVKILEQPPVSDNDNLIAGSIHKTVSPPVNKDYVNEVWVLNASAVPVRLLVGEYEIFDK